MQRAAPRAGEIAYVAADAPREGGTAILSFRWRTLVDVNPQSSYVALLGVARLRSVWLLPTFVRNGVVIERQLRRTRGVVGYRTGVDIANLGFYHLSAWIDSAAIQEFVHTGPHLHAVEHLTGRLGHTTFRYWTVTGSDLPMQFERELDRVEHEQVHSAR